VDFIERWFHVSPDGGSGALEMLLVIGLPILVALVFLVFRRGYFFDLLQRYANLLRRRET
jgi:hypothetical protein